MTTSEQTEPTRLRMVAADSWRFGLIALIAFLTLVDLFATQAILPSLVIKFGVSRATMGFAVNASTFGMAVAGIAVALFGRNLDRRNGIWISLAVLAIPTTLLSQTDSILVFALLRVAQGLCMSTAFTLTMAYLAEHFSTRQTTSALAAYVTGNVASNFFGRLMSAAVADTFGISTNFLTFAALNLIGAALVWFTLQKTSAMMRADAVGESARAAWKGPLGNAELRACFAIGFLILFVFIGTFTYVNFQLVATPLSLSPMALGLVYFVFLAFHADHAARWARRYGPRPKDGHWRNACARDPGFAFAAHDPSSHCSRRDGPGRHWHLPGAGDSDRTCQPNCLARPRRRKRHLPCVLLCGRARRQLRHRTGLRPDQLDRMRGSARRDPRRRDRDRPCAANSKGMRPNDREFNYPTKETEMTNTLKTLIASGAILMAIVLPAVASDGVVTVKSDYSVAETVARIKKDVLKKGIKFFGVIDQAKLGKDAGNDVRPSRLVMFGNPALGTTFITSNPEAGLDWPVRVLVYQTADGAVFAAYSDFDWIAKRHGITDREAQFKMATEVIQSVTSTIKKN